MKPVYESLVDFIDSDEVVGVFRTKSMFETRFLFSLPYYTSMPIKIPLMYIMKIDGVGYLMIGTKRILMLQECCFGIDRILYLREHKLGFPKIIPKGFSPKVVPESVMA